MDTVLLRTKLYVPAARPELVPRSRLIDRLNAGLSRQLTLIAAPAGYGKTTLLSTWVASCGYPVVWLSLDAGDNDPIRFLAYLVAALQTIDAQVGQDVLTALHSPQPSTIEDWLPVLINQLDKVTGRFILVLDDYHVITTPAIHQALTFLLEHQLPHMHLAITTRKDPPLPLPRLRARGQLTELRQSDLRFTIEETAAFLQRVMGTELPKADVTSLVNRTEGWIAGLQMAALSIQDKGDVAPFMSTFGGSHEYIVDYFASEVLAQQPESLRTFLRQTSILDRLCGPLCDAVTGQIDGQTTLEHLERANLFVIPLDNERCWYRYHHLFRDLLHKQLQHEQPEIVPELQYRASLWCEEHELIYEAIDYALSASNEQRTGQLLNQHARSLLIQHGRSYFLNGEHVTLLRWTAALPDALRIAQPSLGILRAIMLSATGKMREAERALQEVDQALSNPEICPNPDRDLLGQAATAHALVATLQDDPQVILFYARRAMELSTGESGWRNSVLMARGNANFLIGDLAACIQDLTEAIEGATASNIPLIVLVAIPKLAQTYWMQGRLNQAAETCQAGFQYMDQKGLARSPMSDDLFTTWGAILCERNDLDRAGESVLRGLELSRAGHVVLNQLSAYRTMTRICLAKGNLPDAEEFIRRAEMLAQEYGISLRHKSRIHELKIEIWIRQGRHSEAEQELQALGVQPAGAIPLTHHGLYFAYARLLLAQGKWSVAEQTLDRLADFSRSSGQDRWLISIHILRAILSLGRQDWPKALNALEAALELAEPEGFLQDFLDEGEPMMRLLQEAVRRKVRPEFAHQLLGRFSSSRPAEKPTGLIEPLSEREVEVLHLVAEGLSNQEIAARLYLSLPTIKFHTGNIYGKLGVKSRTEAVSKARDLGLLSS